MAFNFSFGGTNSATSSGTTGATTTTPAFTAFNFGGTAGAAPTFQFGTTPTPPTAATNPPPKATDKAATITTPPSKTTATSAAPPQPSFNFAAQPTKPFAGFTLPTTTTSTTTPLTTTLFAPTPTKAQGGGGAPKPGTPSPVPSPALGPKSLFAAAAIPAPLNLAPVVPNPTFANVQPSKPIGPSVSFASTVNSSSKNAPPPAFAVLSSSEAAAQSKDYFGENIKQHPIWSHLSALGSFNLPPPPAKTASETISPSKKDATNAPLSTPFESRLAASFSGNLFFLIPPVSSAAAAATTGTHSSKCSRLYFLDLKPLKTHHLKTRADQLQAHESGGPPAYRELICTPTPLPPHSHTIQLNSQATYAAVHSTNTCYLVSLASNKMEKAVMYADPINSHQTGIKVKSAAVGSWFHQNNTTLQILQVSFHPLSDIHLLILTNDSVLRIYNIKENLNLPIKELTLNTISQTLGVGGVGGYQSGNMSRSGSRRGSTWGAGGTPNMSRMSSTSQAQQIKPMIVAFSFGSQPATRTAAMGTDHNSWDLFSIYFLFSNGAITLLCPYVPPQVSLDRRLVLDLFHAEQTRLNEVEDALNEASDSQALSYELEQIQARLLWLTQTFGHVDDPATPGAMDVGNFVVTRDASAHEFAHGWIQPAHSCGATTATPGMSTSASSSSLAAPPLLSAPSGMNGGGGGGNGYYAYPASHLFAFRHGGTAPPGRFFRGFIDGRLDLLLRLVPVRPFFATPSVRSLCEEVDEFASNTMQLAPNTSLEELSDMFAAGGCFENYSIGTLLLPADISKLDGIELPVVPPLPLPSNAGGYSRSTSYTPSMSRLPSGGSPAFSRMASSVSAGLVASPLQLFLPQYRPLIDLYDAAGLFIVAPHVVSSITYGDQIDEVTSVLGRGEEDAFSSVQQIFQDMQNTQKPVSSLELEEKTRKIVGCVLLNDPLLGKYLIHLSSTTNQGPVVEVLELVRPQQKSINVKSILQASEQAISSGAVVPRASGPIDPSTVALDASLTPFASEIAPFFAKFKNWQPPAGIPPGVVGSAGSYLNSPEALGEFLRIRKHYVDTIQELTLVHQLIRSRLAILGKFSDEQTRMFLEVEKQIVACRANQATLEEKIKLHQEIQQQLGVSQTNQRNDAAQGVASELTLQLSDLSPAEIAFHQHLLSLHSSTVPELKHKLAELDRKSQQIQQIQQELKQAAKMDARKGLAGPESKTVWSDRQIEAIQPVLANQSSAVNALVQQLSDLHKTMLTIRSHPAWQQRTNRRLLGSGSKPNTEQKLLREANA